MAPPRRKSTAVDGADLRRTVAVQPQPGTAGLRFMDPQTPLLDHPLDVEAAGEGLLLRGPDGRSLLLSREAAQATGRKILGALTSAEPGEVYQKPLG